MFDEFLSRATALRSQERPFATAVVVRYQPPVSGKPGDKAIIEADGTIWGWIGGGCVQPVGIQEGLKGIEDRNPRLDRNSTTLTFPLLPARSRLKKSSIFWPRKAFHEIGCRKSDLPPDCILAACRRRKLRSASSPKSCR